MQLMKVGDKWKITLPSELAYGDNAISKDITAGSVLIFEIEMVEVCIYIVDSYGYYPSFIAPNSLQRLKNTRRTNSNFFTYHIDRMPRYVDYTTIA